VVGHPVRSLAAAAVLTARRRKISMICAVVTILAKSTCILVKRILVSRSSLRRTCVVIGRIRRRNQAVAAVAVNSFCETTAATAYRRDLIPPLAATTPVMINAVVTILAKSRILVNRIPVSKSGLSRIRFVSSILANKYSPSRIRVSMILVNKILVSRSGLSRIRVVSRILANKRSPGRIRVSRIVVNKILVSRSRLSVIRVAIGRVRRKNQTAAAVAVNNLHATTAAAACRREIHF